MSVVLPVYNGAAYIGEAVASVLAQTLSDLEVVVVDDGSTDGSAEIVSRFQDERIVLLRHERNRGLVAALNTGIDVARGRYLAIQNADDVSLPTRMEAQAELLEADPRLVVVGSAWEVVDQSGHPVGMKTRPPNDALVRWMSLFLTPFGHPTVMLRMETLQRHGLRYEQEFFLAEDFRLWSLLLRYGLGANLEQALVRYRTHPGQITTTTWDEQSTMAERVSQLNLAELGVALDIEAVRRLRILALHPPRRFERADFELVPALLTAIAALEREHPGSHLRAARRMLADAAFGSALRGASSGLRSSGALRALARAEPIWLATAPVRWAALRARGGSD